MDVKDEPTEEETTEASTEPKEEDHSNGKSDTAVHDELDTDELVDEIVDYVGEQNRGVVEQAILRRASVVSYGHNYENDEADNGQIRKLDMNKRSQEKVLFHGIF